MKNTGMDCAQSIPVFLYLFDCMPKVGIEPTHHHWYTILSRARLPVPPLRLETGIVYRTISGWSRYFVKSGNPSGIIILPGNFLKVFLREFSTIYLLSGRMFKGELQISCA
jgi:hypothetical protein